MKRIVLGLYLVVFSLMVGCTQAVSSVAPETADETVDELVVTKPSAFQMCPDKRSNMCTMNYLPVCAKVKEGDKMIEKTYSNACSACADRRVISYIAGECQVK